jgi:glycosyltransferase involved in cell wall biosynthesis
MVMPFFTAFEPFLHGDKQVVGMPSIYKLWEALTRLNHTVEVVFILDKKVNPTDIECLNSSLSSIYRIKTHAIILTNSIPDWLNKLHIGISLMLGLRNRIVEAIKLRRIILKSQPDLMYIDLSRAFLDCLVAYTCKIPAVVRAYGTGIGALKYHNFISTFRFWIRNYFNFILYKMPYKCLIMTNDGTHGDLIAKIFRVNSKKVIFWMNGVDKTIDITENEVINLRSKLNLPSQKKVILAVSRLADWKRVDRIIDAIPHVISVRSDVIFIIVGNGPEYKKLVNRAAKLGMTDSVLFPGAYAHRDVYVLMKMADIFVSLYDLSNLCNPVLEAMSLGRCIVSLNDNSLSGLILNYKNGVLIEPDKITNDLPSVLMALIANDLLRTKIGAAAKDTIMGSIDSWDERINKEIKLLERIFLKNS